MSKPRKRWLTSYSVGAIESTISFNTSFVVVTRELLKVPKVKSSTLSQ